MSGPLQGVKIVEMELFEPIQWAGIMLADMGARVVRINRPIAANIGLFGEIAEPPVRRSPGERGPKKDLALRRNNR